jgi:hypothetical protein
MLKGELNGKSIWTRIDELRQRDLNLLAPKFKLAVEKSLVDLAGRSTLMGSKSIPLDVLVFETARTNELQEIYYQQGTSNAKDAFHSWHFYGLAIDVISKKYEWFGNKAAKIEWPNDLERMKMAEKWFLTVGGFFEANGCKLGAKWKRADYPHIQWGLCADSPHEAPELYREQGVQAVWEAVRAA